MLSPDLQRLEHIRDNCVAIETTIARYGNSFEIFDSDEDYQRSIAFSILQIGEVSSGLSEEFRRLTAAYIPWSMIRGMRNIVVHNYGSVNRKTLWQTVQNDIPVLKQFCEEELAKGRE